MEYKPRFIEDDIWKGYQEALRLYLGRDDVTGVDIGYRYEAGRRTDQLIIRIHTIKGVDPGELLADWPGIAPITVVMAKYVAQAQLARIANPRKDRHDPIKPGISVGRKNADPGTMGLILRDDKGEDAILSAAHVLDGAGSGSIYQPYPQDLAGSNNRIAALRRAKLQGVDAAVARLNNKRKLDPQQFGSGILVKGVRRAIWGDRLEKSARTTDVRQGVVDGVGKYKYDIGIIVTVEGFRVIPETLGVEISLPGDSGSVWYHIGSNEGAGLHVAGEDDPAPEAEHAIASHLDLALQELGIPSKYWP